MQTGLVILAAVAPAVVLLFYIYIKDSAKPEPVVWLLKGALYGVMSALLALFFDQVIELVTGMHLDVDREPSMGKAFLDAFCFAAIPEECAKLIMLWLLLRKNPYFDESFDGIVYAVCVGMGFAGFENVLYLIGGVEDGSWIGTGVSRALFAVPGHFLFAVFMGYYYSLYHFGRDHSTRNLVLMLVAPVFAHGMYDGILFSMHIGPAWSGICMIIFLFIFNKIRKRGKMRINELVGR